jgi:sugar (pentulose or hexulose) kinase
MQLYLGLDLGTSNVKAVVVDRSGRLLAQSAAPVERVALPGGAVEQNIEQIWSATCRSIRTAVATIDARQIAAVGVSSQGGALQLLDAGEQPLGPVISWLDGRGEPYDAELTRRWGDAFLVEHLGRAPCAMTPGQWLRLRRESPERVAQAAGLGFVGDVIVGRLAGRRAHDATSLSIAMLFNPALKLADPTVLAELELPAERLPTLLPATATAGTLRPAAAAATGLPGGIPVGPAIHDQYAALLGAGAVRPGDVSLGTGSAWVLVVNTRHLERPVARGAFVCTHPISGMFGQLISMVNGGSALAWAMRLLGRSEFSIGDVDAAVAEITPGADGLCFWPLLASGAASADRVRGGRLTGIGFGHTAHHLVRAVLEGLACELARYVNVCQRGGLTIERLVLSGPAATSRVTPQIVADVTGRPVLCCTRADASAWGAAVLARAIDAPASELAELALAWSPSARQVMPDDECPVYRDLLTRYLEPFSAGESR